MADYIGVLNSISSALVASEIDDSKQLLDFYNKTLSEYNVGSVEELTEKDQELLLLKVIGKINSDGLVIDVPGIDFDELALELLEEDPNDSNDEITETNESDGDSSDDSEEDTDSDTPDESNDDNELDDAMESAKKLKIAEKLLKSYDIKLSKYESLDIEQVLIKLAKYESLGHSPAKIKTMLTNMIEGNKMNKTKHEEDETMTTDSNVQDTVIKDLKDEIEVLKEKLKAYEDLGTPEDIEELTELAEQTADDTAEMTEKNESMNAQLNQYKSIGTPASIKRVLASYGNLRTKLESIRMSKKLGVKAKVAFNLINKLESVDEAEATLRGLLPSIKRKQVAGAVNKKYESEKVLRTTSKTQKTKNESENLDSLRRTCERL